MVRRRRRVARRRTARRRTRRRTSRKKTFKTKAAARKARRKGYTIYKVKGGYRLARRRR
ncbi:MAG: hypothetical protein ACE5J4_00310 [Candidatus Aenigmatarchaeota archaeon]